MSDNNDFITKPKIRMDRTYRLENRKTMLFNELNNVKLEYKQNGICDSYIKYGKPSLEEVIDDLTIKSNNQTDRLKLLVDKLALKNIKFDDRIEIFNNYVKNGGDLKKVIKEGEIEYWYWNKTEYPVLIEKYNEDIAKNIALNKYIKKNGHNKYTNKIIKKEMTLSLY